MEKINEMLQHIQDFNKTQIDEMGLGNFASVLLLSLLTSLFISLCYRLIFQNRGTGSHIHRVFPLLGVSVTGIFICIQFSLPLSLGLLGALSIVRFRTPIKEPEEIGFIMLVIACSIACATFNLPFLFLILGVAILGVLLQTWGACLFVSTTKRNLLLLKGKSHDSLKSQSQWMEVLNAHVRSPSLCSMTKDGDCITMQFEFGRLLKGKSWSQLEADLNMHGRDFADYTLIVQS